MNRRRTMIHVATVIIMVVLLAGWSCSPTGYARAGQLAKDLAASVLVAQQVEIQEQHAGFIDTDLHKAFQNELIQVAAAGKSLDAAINQDHSAQGAIAQIKVLDRLLQDLSQNKLAGIKDQNSKLALQAALLTIQTTLDNIAAFGGGVPTGGTK